MAIYLKNFEIEQQLAFHPIVKDALTFDNWIKSLGSQYRSIEKMVGIIHDKDQQGSKPKEPHFHLYVRMKTNQDIEWIAKVFGVPNNFVNRIEGKWKDALAYATHLNRPEKYQYDMSELHLWNMTLQEYEDQAKNVELEELTIKQALFDYGDCKITKKKLLEDFLTNSSLYLKYQSVYKKMQEFRKLKVKDRNMQVLYISGGAGSGKTTLAKYLSEIYGYDCFVTGSGADPFDSYDNEECIILDDFRSDTFTKAELFKLTDNNTDSSVKSRFQNKNISYCKLMIITSIKTPLELYDWSADNEPFEQFARRLKWLYINIFSSGKVYEMHYNKADYSKITPIECPFNMSLVFDALNIEQDVGESLMKNVYSMVREDLKKKGKM